MATILASCRWFKIEDKVVGTVSEQVETGQNCSLVICDYGNVQELCDTRANKKENMAEIVFLRGAGGGK